MGMGAYSIWHGVILIVIVASVVVPIMLADENRKIGRQAYVLRSIGYLVVVIGIGALAAAVGGGMIAIGANVLGMIAGIFWILWTVHRIQDIGWSKWLCLLMLVPLVNIAFWFLLAFSKPNGAHAPETSAV